MRKAARLLGALMMIGAPGVAAAADRQAATWPCGDMPHAPLSLSDLWPGASDAPGWRDQSEIAGIVSAVTPRSVSQEDAQAEVGRFLAHASRAQALTLAAGIVDSVESERRQIISGIRRFNGRQDVLARRIEHAYTELDTPLPPNADKSAQEAHAALEDQAQWDNRALEDRRRLLPIICKQPALLEQRAGSLVAGIRSSFDTPYLLYVSNERSGDVSVVDPVLRRETKRIPIGKRPRGLVVSPDRRTLYVAVSGSPIGGPGVDEDKLPPADKAADGIAVIDLATGKLVRTLRGISDPEQIAISPDGTRLYVASEDSGQLIVLGTDGHVIARVMIGDQPEGIAVSPDGKTILATSEGSNSVTVVDAATLKVTGHVPVGERPRNALFLAGGLAAVPGEFDASVSIVDLRAARLVKTIKLDQKDRPMALAALADGRFVVSTGRGGRLVKIDAQRDDGGLTGSGSVGARPWGLALSPDRSLAYTANGPSNDVGTADTATLAVLGRISVSGDGPWSVIAVQSAKPRARVAAKSNASTHRRR